MLARNLPVGSVPQRHAGAIRRAAATFLQMVGDPEYQKITHLRTRALREARGHDETMTQSWPCDGHRSSGGLYLEWARKSIPSRLSS